MKNYRVGVIGRTGHGNYGHGLDSVWSEFPNIQVVGVADDDKAGLAAAAKRLKVDQAYVDYRQLLDEQKPDIVAIAQRWLDKHHEMALECARRGIHMFMEKPFCRSLEEADEIVAACEKNHTKLCLAHQTHYSPKLKVVQDLIAAGKIGKVLEYRGRGKEDQRGGGEDLWVLGSHIMDLIRTLGGAPQWCFANVAANGKNVTQTDVIEGKEGIGPLAGDAVRAMYGMSDGSTAYFSSVRGTGGGKSRFGLQIYGSTGVIEIVTGHVLPSVAYLDDPAWSPTRSGKGWQSVSSAGIGQAEPIPEKSLHGGNILVVQDLLAAIEANRQPLCGMYEGRGTVEMISAVFESHRQGKPVAMPLVNRKNPLSML